MKIARLYIFGSILCIEEANIESIKLNNIFVKYDLKTYSIKHLV